ncbi:MAG TPA: DUF1800 domain-containing protein [Acetobacteraceae bacterium]|nr:DUF1800 domain-containing protein [Acetobacteraceae bacterium]
MAFSAAHAHARFGLGRTPRDQAPADPQAWLAAQLRVADPGPQGVTVADAFAALRQDRADRPPPGQPGRARQIFQAETGALEDWAVATETPFRERLAWFWANHFTVSQRRFPVAPLAGAYVREAIRPHVTGRFADMLLAVMRHPAMLLYLDNAGSTGPDSVFGRRSGRGMNENLARECLELHTVSPASGYAQADVGQLARLLTGWSVDRQEVSGFRFRPALHEPGEKTLLGRTFPEGEAGGAAALLFLADHPATHRHLATKLVRHFVADVPPPDDVRRVEGVLRDTGGDLGKAALEVTRLPGAWQPLTKLRTPQELVLATLRGAALPPERRPEVNGIMAGLGQTMFGAPFPIGWPDTAADWAGPEAMLRRIDWCYGFASRPELPEPEAFSEILLGKLLSEATAAEMRRAGSRRDAITTLLASPEFQRR